MNIPQLDTNKTIQNVMLSLNGLNYDGKVILLEPMSLNEAKIILQNVKARHPKAMLMQWTKV